MYGWVCVWVYMLLLRLDSALVLRSRKWQLLVHDHLFTRLHPPLPCASAHINPVSISQPQLLFSLGGLRHTTGGCKTCLWGLLTVPSLRQLAQMDWPSFAGLCWVWLAHLQMDSLSLCLWLFPFSVFVSRQFRTSFPGCLAFVQLPFALFHLLIPLGRMLLWLYLSRVPLKHNVWIRMAWYNF